MDIKTIIKIFRGMPESFRMDKDIAFLMNQEATMDNIHELIKQKEVEFEKERNK
jgi:hypothetical protein